MSPQRISERTTPEIQNLDVFKGKPSLRHPASPRARSREVDRAQVVRELRVLVVADGRDIADSLVRRLRRWGHAARTAQNGLAALRVAAAQHPDVVLLDMEMPFMDGYQIARHLRLDFPRRTCFLIAVTARSEDEHREQCIQAGIDLLLIKPIDLSDVETTLLLECELVNRRHSLRADSKQRCRYRLAATKVRA
ncbi:MAG: response regulator [Planctomycetota bacterium]|nr:response regulator [Planctomycetota bacterium]